MSYAKAKKVAHGVVEKQNAILTTTEDRTLFFDALENPSKPNKALKEAAKYYLRTSIAR